MNYAKEYNVTCITNEL